MTPTIKVSAIPDETTTTPIFFLLLILEGFLDVGKVHHTRKSSVNWEAENAPRSLRATDISSCFVSCHLVQIFNGEPAFNFMFYLVNLAFCLFLLQEYRLRSENKSLCFTI